MALSKEQALDAAKAIITGPRAGEAPRLERIRAALKPRIEPWDFIPTVQIPADAPDVSKDFARKAATNYLPLLVKTYAQVIKADGYYSVSDEGGTDPWTWWQRNRMDSRQTGLFRSALQYGAGYATVLPGTYGRGEFGPSIGLYSPRQVTAVYQDPEADEWPMLALARDIDGRGRIMYRLFDEEQVHTFGVETPPSSGWEVSTYPAGSVELGSDALTWIDAQDHAAGVCPVIRFRDRNLLCGEEQYGIVEPLMTVQERIDETEYQGMVTRYFQAFMQLYVLGWVPEDQAEEFKAGAARIWYLDEDPKDVEIKQLQAHDGRAHSEAAKDAKRDFAAMGQIPVQTLGIDGISNISDATLAGLEAAKNREAGEVKTSLGEAGEQMLRLCAYYDGNQAAADDYTSELRWRDFEARSFAQTVDGLGKLVTQLGLDPAIALEDVPGMTEQRLERAKNAMKQQQARAALDRVRSLAANGTGNSPAPQ